MDLNPHHLVSDDIEDLGEGCIHRIFRTGKQTPMGTEGTDDEDGRPYAVSFNMRQL